MNRRELCAAAVKAMKAAQKSGKRQWVIEAPDEKAVVSEKYQSDWLFNIYPGGRNTFSHRGAAIMDADRG